VETILTKTTVCGWLGAEGGTRIQTAFLSKTTLVKTSSKIAARSDFISSLVKRFKKKTSLSKLLDLLKLLKISKLLKSLQLLKLLKNLFD
jgi:hypothetical protein